MSKHSEPKPLALTAAMLMERSVYAVKDKRGTVHALNTISAHECATIATDLHRLQVACVRIAVGCCNESCWGDAQAIVNGDEMSEGYKPDHQTLACVAYIKRTDKRLEAINERLAPLKLKAKDGGDPRGCVLKLYSTDPRRPVPRTGWDDCWGIWN